MNRFNQKDLLAVAPDEATTIVEGDERTPKTEPETITDTVTGVSAAVAPFPLKLISISALSLLMILLSVSWFVYDTYRFVKENTVQILTLEQAHGDIIHLDEVLTMSSMMAVATGDIKWIERYRQAEPKLDMAIDEARKAARTPRIAEAIHETQIANLELIKMENQAFVFVQTGQLDSAEAVLGGASYIAQKQTYAHGMQELLNRIQDQQLASTRSRKTTAAGIFLAIGAVAAMIGVVWYIVLARVQEWQGQLSNNVADLMKADALLRQSRVDLELETSRRANERGPESIEKRRVEFSRRDSVRGGQATSETRSQFLSAMSHDLRTPLNAVIGFGQLMQNKSDEPLTERQNRYTDHIIKAGEHMLEQLNEALDLASIEANQLNLAPVTLQVDDVIKESIALVKPAARIRVIDIIYHTADQPGALIVADRLRITQSVINLLTNALKYNKPNGTITIQSQEVDSRFLRLLVRNSASGSPAPDNSLALEGAPSACDDPDDEGVAKGLSVTRQLVERMGGRIGVENNPGAGSLLWIDIPLAFKMSA